MSQHIESFKDFTQRLCVTLEVASLAMDEFRDSPKITDEGFFDCIETESNQVVSRMPSPHLYQGMRHDGPISQFFVNSAITFIFFFWEKSYRPKIAEELGVEDSKVVFDILGDIRILRNCIAHDLSFLSVKDSKKLKAIDWVKPGRIILNLNDFKKIQLKINEMSI